ncbi:DMT family transporter [Papillibacter cinnamivorans]|uniref:EamA domain-containing membrane protein RarD n=1 Tax=Papillibacter cinnamivorans DSM 12816 TaxID=1122930 RepID=A0A1W2AXR7_9FIRM|nr:DMT family transporter [Papillibacter cinnamivorans]SMC65404.1 EamA domain-containing membrane protein RarD [Papillibacter cinnamivorans DSM 12816]
MREKLQEEGGFNTNKSYLKYISALLIFGTNGIVASFIPMGSMEIVFLRTLIGSAFLLAVFLIKREKFQAFQKPGHFSYLMISGAALGAGWMFLYEGYRRLGVGPATLEYYFGPVIVMALAPLVFKEKLVPGKTAGIGAAVLGMALLGETALRQGGFSWGMVCGGMAAVMYAVMVVFSKKAAGIGGLENSLWQLASAFVTVAAFLLINRGFTFFFAPGNILAVLLLGAVNTGVGCWLYFSAVERLPVQSVAVCGYLEPLSALVFSAAFLGERLSPAQLFGAVLILGGAAYGEALGERFPQSFLRFAHWNIHRTPGA